MSADAKIDAAGAAARRRSVRRWSPPPEALPELRQQLREAGPVVWLERYATYGAARHADVFSVLQIPRASARRAAWELAHLRSPARWQSRARWSASAPHGHSSRHGSDPAPTSYAAGVSNFGRGRAPVRSVLAEGTARRGAGSRAALRAQRVPGGARRESTRRTSADRRPPPARTPLARAISCSRNHRPRWSRSRTGTSGNRHTRRWSGRIWRAVLAAEAAGALLTGVAGPVVARRSCGAVWIRRSAASRRHCWRAASPDRWEAVRRAPSLLPSAFDEALRLEAQPRRSTVRRRTRPRSRGSGSLPTLKVQLFIGAANRDPAALA